LIHDPTLSPTPLSRNLPAAIEAAIFDFDETMIDLEEQHSVASEALCRAMGNDYASMPDEFRLGSGRRVIDDVRHLRSYFGWTAGEEALLEIRQRAFDEACRSADLELMPGVEEAVRQLHESGMRLAVTSSAVRGAIEAILRRFAVRDLFDVIVDGSEVRNGKPDPEAYLLTARRLDVSPQHCIVFEDSTVGVAAAKNAGMFCIAVRNPHALTKQDLDVADVVVDSFAELDLGALASRSRRAS
jgi:HAD superfamily hydrolase (TIGR01509 family)